MFVYMHFTATLGFIMHITCTCAVYTYMYDHTVHVHVLFNCGLYREVVSLYRRKYMVVIILGVWDWDMFYRHIVTSIERWS